MSWKDHAPPHFHALYAEHEAKVDIRSMEIIEGNLPNRALALVVEWAELHQSELMENWKLCEAMQRPNWIDPLE